MGHADAPQGDIHAGAQRAFGQAARGIHAALRPACRDHGFHRRCRCRRNVYWTAPVPWLSQPVALTGPLCGRDQGKLQRRLVGLAGGRRTGRVQGGRVRADADDRHRPLVHPVRPHERGDFRVGKTRVQPRGEARGVGERQQLREHRAGVPVHVPVAAFPVPPAGAPRDAGDDQRGRGTVRRGSDLDEGVLERVVPVHPGRQRAALRHRDVHLEREPRARRPRRAEQVPPVGKLRRPHHAGGQVQQPGQVRQVHLGRGDPRRPREHVQCRHPVRGSSRGSPRRGSPGAYRL